MRHSNRLPTLITLVALATLTTNALFGFLNNSQRDYQRDSELMQKKAQIQMAFNNNSDTDEWHEKRAKMAMAIGDRTFSADFNRVFDSLMIAVASLELKVSNMERQSGYIAATGISLSPSKKRALNDEALSEWCALSGFDPSILDKEYKTQQVRQAAQSMDFSGMMNKFEKMQRGLVFQLIKMSDEETKVKLRFSDVYYPPELELYYKKVWEAVDKQIFVDTAVEGEVEDRD